MSKSGFSTGQLRAFIDRVERLEEEKAALAADIKEVYAEAKGSGFDVKTMRKIVSLRKLDDADRQEAEAMLDLYKGALGMDGTPLGDYDRLTSAVESAGPRVADVKAKLAEGESVDPETGEITESRAKADDEAAGTEREMPSVESVSRLDARRSASATSEIMDVTSRERPAHASMAESVDAADLKSAALKHEGSSPSAGTNDIGEIPPFLDRRPKARAAEMA